MDLKRDLSARPSARRHWQPARLYLFVGVIAVGATFPSGAARAQGNSTCARWCAENFPPGRARGLCISAAARGAGPCHVCGPEGNNAGLCGGVCCPAGEICSVAGACFAPVPTPTPTPVECGVLSGDPNGGTATCGGRCPLEFPFCEFVSGTAGGRCTCVDHHCGGPGNPRLACNDDFCPDQGQICTTLADGSCGCGPPPTPSILQPHCLCIFAMPPGAVSCRLSLSPAPVCASDCPSFVAAECAQFCDSNFPPGGCGGLLEVKSQCVETGRSCM